MGTASSSRSAAARVAATMVLAPVIGFFVERAGFGAVGVGGAVLAAAILVQALRDLPHPDAHAFLRDEEAISFFEAALDLGPRDLAHAVHLVETGERSLD